MDIYDSGYPGKVTLYIYFAILDAMWQTAAYWLMGAMSNDPAKLAHFAGFCMFVCPVFFYSSLIIPRPQTSHYNPQALLVFGVQMQ